jgi:hypothetical protein
VCRHAPARSAVSAGAARGTHVTASPGVEISVKGARDFRSACPAPAHRFLSRRFGERKALPLRAHAWRPMCTGSGDTVARVGPGGPVRNHSNGDVVDDASASFTRFIETRRSSRSRVREPRHHRDMDHAGRRARCQHRDEKDESRPWEAFHVGSPRASCRPARAGDPSPARTIRAGAHRAMPASCLCIAAASVASFTESRLLRVSARGRLAAPEPGSQCRVPQVERLRVRGVPHQPGLRPSVSA